MLTHIPACRRGFYTEAGLWVDGDTPVGVSQWHSAVCEGSEAVAAYSLSYVRPKDIRVIDADTRGVIDQSERYPEEIVKFLFSA